MNSTKSNNEELTKQTMTETVIGLVAKSLGVKPTTIGPETTLFSGLKTFDSFALLELVLRLESTFGLSIPDEDLDRDTFSSPQTIVTYLSQRLRTAPSEETMHATQK